MAEIRGRTVDQASRQLNDAQREAFLQAGNVVLLAGPGSGKTATLVMKVAKLLGEIDPPRGLACLTYANEAAREFERRLRVLGVRGGSRLYTGTVHAFCLAHVLRPFGSRLPAERSHLINAEIANEDELAVARRRGLDAVDLNEPDVWWQARIGEYRRLALIEPSLGKGLDVRLPTISAAYENYLRKINRVDFDEVVGGSLWLIENDGFVRSALAAKYPWLVVDEYQDLGLALHRMVQKLMDHAGVRIFAVGDPDQSIYGFNGARPAFLTELSTRHDVCVRRLQLNYRCAQEIIDVSLQVLKPEAARDFRAHRERRGEIHIQQLPSLDAQADYASARILQLLGAGIPAGRIAVFTKRREDLLACGDVFKRAGVPCRITGSNSYRETRLTNWVAEMARWCATTVADERARTSELFRTYAQLWRSTPDVLAIPDDLSGRASFYRMLVALRDPNLPLALWVAELDQRLSLSRLEQARFAPQQRHDVRELHKMLDELGSDSTQTIAEFCGIDGKRVALQTFHGSKGLEYHAVFMLALEEGVLPAYKTRDMAEDRRIFYVGMTRAEAEVHLLSSGFFVGSRGKLCEMGDSRFIGEVRRRMGG